MSIKTEINRIRGNVAAAYSAAAAKGADMPANMNSDNLAATVLSIETQAGGGGSRRAISVSVSGSAPVYGYQNGYSSNIYATLNAEQIAALLELINKGASCTAQVSISTSGDTVVLGLNSVNPVQLGVESYRGPRNSLVLQQQCHVVPLIGDDLPFVSCRVNTYSNEAGTSLTDYSGNDTSSFSISIALRDLTLSGNVTCNCTITFGGVIYE